MKKAVLLCFFLFILMGCSDNSKELDIGMQLRSELLKASSCSFAARITANYDDRICGFTLDCTMDAEGNVSFTVLEPASISGITGKLSGQGGQIAFDDVVLDFPLIGDNLPSPVSAPWIMVKALRSGFLTSVCAEEGLIHLSLDDRYDNEPLQLDIWLNTDKMPTQADVLHDGKRILTMVINNFQIS